MRRIIALGVIVIALTTACGSKKNDSSSTPTLPTADPSSTLPGAGADPAVSSTVGSTFKPTEECTAINNWGLADFAVGVVTEDQRPQYVTALEATVVTAKEKVPDLSGALDVLLDATRTFASTGATTPEQGTAVEAASATVQDWWAENCV